MKKTIIAFHNLANALKKSAIIVPFKTRDPLLISIITNCMQLFKLNVGMFSRYSTAAGDALSMTCMMEKMREDEIFFNSEIYFARFSLRQGMCFTSCLSKPVKSDSAFSLEFQIKGDEPIGEPYS
jgi:hypothetical protein